MSYIGQAPTTTAFVTDQFSGTGSQTAFTMSVAPASTSSVLVAVTGVLQDPSTYSVSGTTLTFSAAPPSGTGNISVRYLGIPASGVTTTAYRTVTNFTATAGQTTFSVPSYTVGYIDVYRNGARLGAADFTATSGTTVILTNPATAGDLVVTESFYVSSVLNAIPATAGAVNDSYISAVSASKLTGSRTLPSGTLPAGTVLQVVSSVNRTYFVTTTTGSWVSTGISASITPTSATSKILVLAAPNTLLDRIGSNDNLGWLILDRNGTKLAGSYTELRTYDRGGSGIQYVSTPGITVLDSPATTSAVTYTIYGQIDTGVNTLALNIQETRSPTVDGSGYSATTITLMEIAA